MASKPKPLFAYLEIIMNHGVYDSFKLDMNNKQTEHKLRNLMAGSITTFDIIDEDKDFKVPVGTDRIVSQTRTFYPANILRLKVTIVESDEPNEPH